MPMLEIRPNCELCDKDLPANAMDAMICTYECTFCSECVTDVLKNVCPNCAGGFTIRPIRPIVARRVGLSLAHQPASTTRVHTNYSVEALQEFSASVKDIVPKDR